MNKPHRPKKGQDSKQHRKFSREPKSERRNGRDRRKGTDRRSGFDRRRDQDHSATERKNLTRDWDWNMKRALVDRRSGKDRRKRLRRGRIFYRKPEKRSSIERRLHGERRTGWVRISKWSSVNLRNLKISKFLKIGRAPDNPIDS